MALFTTIALIDYAAPLAKRLEQRKFTSGYRWTPSDAKAAGPVGFYTDKTGAMAPHGALLNLRIENANDHLAGSRLSMTNGYYCDLDGGDTLQPIIARLPRGRGFLAGWTMGANMCASLERFIHATEEEAAYAAHQMADSDAEDSRERQQDERDAEDEEDMEDEDEEEDA